MTSASRGFASNYRIVIIASLIVLAFAGIGWRLADLHILSREHYLTQLDRARHRLERLPARRGDIRGVDRFGMPSEVLATSRTLIHLGVDPQMVREEDREKRAELASLLELPLSEINRIMDTKTRASTPAASPLPLPDASIGDESEVDDVNPDTGVRQIRWAKLSDTVEESTYARILALKIRGVYGNRTYIRSYPQRSIAAHVVGYINKEGIPSGGIEDFADFYLRGQDGWRESEKDGLRRELPQFRIREVQPSDGYDVVISIDTFVQHIVEQEMDNLVTTFKPEKATIIVSEPDSGFLLALANYPTYDLNKYSTTPISVQRNVAATDLIEPGSTFKIVAAAGALNEHLVNPNTVLNCAPGVTVLYRGKTRRLMRDDHAENAPLSVANIIARSSNAGAAQLGILLGDNKFYEYARAFGFGEKSGFPLGYEEGGIFARPEKWSDIDMTRIPAGYSIATTPLQIHYAMAAIANGGTLMTPRILREVPDFFQLGNSSETSPSLLQQRHVFGRLARRAVITPQTAATMRQLLQRVASPEGTAKAAAIPGFEVAGKTGTAQKLINGRYSNRNHVGSFVGFFPASRPRVVISVIVDDGHPANGRPGYGAVVAIPSFKRISEQLIQYLDIKPVGDLQPGGKPANGHGGLLAQQGNIIR